MTFWKRQNVETVKGPAASRGWEETGMNRRSRRTFRAVKILSV